MQQDGDWMPEARTSDLLLLPSFSLLPISTSADLSSPALASPRPAIQHRRHVCPQQGCVNRLERGVILCPENQYCTRPGLFRRPALRRITDKNKRQTSSTDEYRILRKSELFFRSESLIVSWNFC